MHQDHTTGERQYVRSAQVNDQQASDELAASNDLTQQWRITSTSAWHAGSKAGYISDLCVPRAHAGTRWVHVREKNTQMTVQGEQRLLD